MPAFPAGCGCRGVSGVPGVGQRAVCPSTLCGEGLDAQRGRRHAHGAAGTVQLAKDRLQGQTPYGAHTCIDNDTLRNVFTT
jgi:hypothetical protein